MASLISKQAFTGMLIMALVRFVYPGKRPGEL
jgi:hypothetical protein